MRYPRNTAALGLSLTFVVSTADAFATSSNIRSLHKLHTLAQKNRSLQSYKQFRSTPTSPLYRNSNSHSNTVQSVSNNNNRRASMGMFFSSLFGTPTPSVIDYTTLDYPGNEMGKIAQENNLIKTCERQPNLEAATFAGGCFWGFELAYQRVPGVVYTAVGYAQGPEENPNYSQVCSGGTGHTEAVCVLYDPDECTYETLLDTFFQRVDPTTKNGQGNDRGTQYRTGVYFHTAEQEQKALARFEEEKSNFRRPIAAECKQALPFWPAEKYHQQYLEKGGRSGSGQDASKGATDTIRCYG